PHSFHTRRSSDLRFIFYKPAFAVDLWRYSPGDVLLLHLFEYVRGRDVVEFDFTRGDEVFKSRFANASRRTSTLHVLAPGAGGRLAGWRLQAMAGLRRRPRLHAALQRARALAARVARAGRREGLLRASGRAGRLAW